MRRIIPLACLIFAAAPAAAAPPVFKHIVIVFQENRTPDNLFGSNPNFEPGVDIATMGRTSTGAMVALGPTPLAGCYDIDHSHRSFELALNFGFDAEQLVANQCTGPLPPNPHYRYVDNSHGEVQPYFDIAKNYGFANRMFQTNQGPSFPAHQFIFGGTSAPTAISDLFAAENLSEGGQPGKPNPAGCIANAGQTVSLINPAGLETQNIPRYPCYERRTLGDLLDAANPPISWRYYAPLPGSIWTAPDAIAHTCQAKFVGGVRTCTGPQWIAHVVPDNPAQVLTDIAACNLPGVSWVIPTAQESDHAVSNTGIGPQWVAAIVNAIGTQKCAGEDYWKDTAILIIWDDWGGWFDHVKPLNVFVNAPHWGSGYTYGFRVPLLVVSAYTPPGRVSDGALDFGSILYFVEQNFGLGFIGPGTGTYSRYADYQSSLPPWGRLDPFFGLAGPKVFVPIPTTMKSADFLNQPKSNLGPDND